MHTPLTNEMLRLYSYPLDGCIMTGSIEMTRGLTTATLYYVSLYMYICESTSRSQPGYRSKVTRYQSQHHLCSNLRGATMTLMQGGR